MQYRRQRMLQTVEEVEAKSELAVRDNIELSQQLPPLQLLADDEYCRDPLCSSARHVNQPGT